MNRIAIPTIEFSRNAATDICVQAGKVVHRRVANAKVAFSHLDPFSVAWIRRHPVDEIR